MDLQTNLHNQETQALSVLEMQVDQVVTQEVLEIDHQEEVVELVVQEVNNQVVMLVEMVEPTRLKDLPIYLMHGALDWRVKRLIRRV